MLNNTITEIEVGEDYTEQEMYDERDIFYQDQGSYFSQQRSMDYYFINNGINHGDVKVTNNKFGKDNYHNSEIFKENIKIKNKKYKYWNWWRWNKWWERWRSLVTKNHVSSYKHQVVSIKYLIDSLNQLTLIVPGYF